jgi:hypothetical protein
MTATIFELKECHDIAIDQNARRVIQRMRSEKLDDFTKEDCMRVQWKGLIERCMRCGGRAYRHGWCFGCGKPY